MQDFPFVYMKAALRLYLKYFLGIWIVNLIVLSFAVIVLKINPLEMTTEQSFDINTVILFLHLLLMSFLIYSGNKKYQLIHKDSFRIDGIQLAGSIALGIGAGMILPLLGNIGLLMDEASFLHTQARESIQSFVTFYETMGSGQMILVVLMGSLVFSILREVFFRGLLLALYNRDFNINQSTVQISLLFMLVYAINQVNQFDFFSLFLFSVILCFLTFQTKSLLPAILATIAYDIPILTNLSNPNFYLEPELYMTFNAANSLNYIFAILLIAGGLYAFSQKTPSVEND